MRRESRQFNRSWRRRGLTLIEMLVAVGLVAIVIVSVSQIFRITSDAAAIAEANASLIKQSRIINEKLEHEVRNLAPDGFLAIVAPPPLRHTRELKEGPTVPLDINGIAFLTHGNIGEYESFTTPANPANPALGPVRSSEALVYFGPGNAMTTNPVGAIQPVLLESRDLNALEWPFIHRCILLVPEVSNTQPNMTAQLSFGGLFVNTTSLLPTYANGETDVVYSSNTLQANAQTVARIIQNKDWNTDLGSNNPSIKSLWSRSLAPKTIALDPTNFGLTRKNYYRRNGATMLFGLADFRVEWTDGRPVDPIGTDGIPETGDEDLSTRWFGVRPDPTQEVDIGDLNDLTNYVDSSSAPGVPYYAFRRQDAYIDPNLSASEQAAEQGLQNVYRDRIEWPQGNANGTATALYRAIWRGDTWQYRPKALRFTYRLYDENQRIRNVAEVDFDRDGYSDPDRSLTKAQFVRMGREFSVVVPVP